MFNFEIYSASTSEWFAGKFGVRIDDSRANRRDGDGGGRPTSVPPVCASLSDASEIKFPKINCVTELLTGFVNHSGARDRAIKQRLRGLSLKNHNTVWPGAQHYHGINADETCRRLISARDAPTDRVTPLCTRPTTERKTTFNFSVAMCASFLTDRVRSAFLFSEAVWRRVLRGARRSKPSHKFASTHLT